MKGTEVGFCCTLLTSPHQPFGLFHLFLVEWALTLNLKLTATYLIQLKMLFQLFYTPLIWSNGCKIKEDSLFFTYVEDLFLNFFTVLVNVHLRHSDIFLGLSSHQQVCKDLSMSTNNKRLAFSSSNLRRISMRLSYFSIPPSLRRLNGLWPLDTLLERKKWPRNSHVEVDKARPLVNSWCIDVGLSVRTDVLLQFKVWIARGNWI